MRLRILRLCLDQALTNSELAASLGRRPATVLHHVRTLLAAGFLAEEATRFGPRGTTEKPYRASGKPWRLDRAMTGEDGAMLQAVFDSVVADVEEAGPGAVVQGARRAMRLRPDELDKLVARIQDLANQYPNVDEYLSDNPAEGDPYAMLLVLHRRHPVARHPVAPDQEP